MEEEPAKKAKASTFLNYYLPTTQKLLDSYADFEEAGVSGGNVSQAKQRIADTMDKIVAGSWISSINPMPWMWTAISV